MTNNINANSIIDASTIPPINQVPHILLLNTNKTRESFRAAFLTNLIALINKVFLIYNTTYSMQALIKTLYAS